MGFPRQEYCSWFPFPAPWNFSYPGIKYKSLALIGGFFTANAPEKPVHYLPETLFSSVQSLGHVQLFATPWTAACHTSLSITNSRNPHKHMSIESVMPSNHLILCRPLLLLPSIFRSIRVFSNKSASLHQVAKVLEFQLQHQSFQ